MAVRTHVLWLYLLYQGPPAGYYYYYYYYCYYHYYYYYHITPLAGVETMVKLKL